MSWLRHHKIRWYAIAECLLLAAFSAAAVLVPGNPGVRSDAFDVGFTFSQQQSSYLDLDYRDTYQSLIRLKPSVVRLAAYWNKVEAIRGTYDFSSLDWLVEHTPPPTRVVLSFGTKAPRWPEYFIPAWLEQANQLPNNASVSDDPDFQTALFRYVRAVVEHFRDSPVVAYWQGENEPIVVTAFVPTNPILQLPPLDRPVAERVQAILGQADIVGLDVYAVRGRSVLGRDVFVRWPAFVWQPQLRSLQHDIESAGKQVWITELQAEPWLVTRVVYLDRLPRAEIVPGETSFVLAQMRANGFRSALLWGAEYWYMRLQRFGDDRWWSAARRLIA
jgi:hypothetical protein